MKPTKLPAQQQASWPGHESETDPKPKYVRPGFTGSGRLDGRAA